MSTDPFEPLLLFPIPFFSVRVSDYDDHNPQLRKRIKKMRKRSPGIVRSNRNGWHAGPDFMESDDPHIQWVIDTATRFARRALAPMYSNWEKAELQVGTYWANVLDNGGFNAPHHHTPQHWSGTYYVHVPEPDPKAAAGSDMGGMLEFINPVASYGGGERSGNFAISPRSGMLCLFPSALVHFVHPYTGPQERISIAYNFNIVGRK